MKVVLKVEHGGEAKMTGKVFMQNGRLTFLHEASSSQRHRNLDSPGGPDEIVLDWLEGNGVQEYHHFERDTGKLYITSPGTIRRLGVFQASGGRRRYFLAETGWEKLIQCQSTPPYHIPWITDTVTLHDSGLARRRTTKAPRVEHQTSPAAIQADLPV